MKILRTAIAAALMFSMTGAPAFAGELRDSVAAAAANAAAAPQETPMIRAASSRPVMWTGSALFVGGMTYGLYQFINNENGTNAEFGEADATNIKGGALGLGVAFAGGLMMYMGRAGRHLPSVTMSKSGLNVSKRVTW